MKGRQCVELLSLSPRKYCPIEGRIFCGEDGRWRCLEHAQAYRASLAKARGERQSDQDDAA